MWRCSGSLALIFAVALGGCDLAELLGTTEPNCDPRTAYWPDDDGDGVGEAHTVYIGCDPPDGWVTEPPPEAALPEPGEPVDTAPPVEADHTVPTDTAEPAELSPDTALGAP